MPPMSENRIELSDLLREVEQSSAAVRRNATQIKDALYGSNPEPVDENRGKTENTAIGLLRKTLHDLSRANDELVFLRDSCNLGLKLPQPESSVATGSRY